MVYDPQDIEVPDFLKELKLDDLYEHGLPFSQVLAFNIMAQRDRIELNKATAIFIDGGVGEGKTTLADHVGSYFQRSPLDFHKQLAMGGKNFLKLSEVVVNEGRKVLVYDEAGDFAKQGALTKFNAQLNRFFETYRAFKILVIICVPNFNTLDKKLFDNKIPRLLLHCERRTRNTGYIRGFSLTRMNWLRYWMDKFPKTPHVAFKKVQPNFYATFKNLPRSRSNELEHFSTSAKRKINAENNKKMENHMSIKEIIEKLRRSKAWVQTTMKKHRMKAASRIGATYYYDVGVYERLVQIRDQKGLPPMVV